jgi:hypothetical protein
MNRKSVFKINLVVFIYNWDEEIFICKIIQKISGKLKTSFEVLRIAKVISFITGYVSMK